MVPDLIFEQWTITIQNPDDGYFNLNFVDDRFDDGYWTTTTDIRSSHDAEKVRKRIKAYISDLSDITVVRVMYDANSDVTEVEEDCVTAIFTITLSSLIDGFSTTNIVVIPVDTASTITIALPSDV